MARSRHAFQQHCEVYGFLDPHMCCCWRRLDRPAARGRASETVALQCSLVRIAAITLKYDERRHAVRRVGRSNRLASAFEPSGKRRRRAW